MEHLVFHLILETIQAIDRRLQKPLVKAVPDLAQLRSEPKSYLTQSPIAFGPRRRHALALVCGLFFGGVVVFSLLFTFKHFGPRQPKGMDTARITGLIVSFFVTVFVVRSVVLRMMRGGTLTLLAAGAEFAYGNRSVFLPWELFYTTGAALEPDHKLIVLPVNPWVPVAIADDSGEVKAVLPEDLQSPQIECSDFGQLAIKDLYEVRIIEVGELLRELGLRLGNGQLVGAEIIGRSAPLAIPEGNGWISIHLTQLPFPPVCAGCSQYTQSIVGLNVSADNKPYKLPLPFCESCSQRRLRRQLITFAICTMVGIVSGFFVAWVLFGPGAMLPVLAIGGVIAGAFALILNLIGYLILRDTNNPIRWKDFKREKGTVRIRFRDPKSSVGLIEALGLPTT